MFTETYGNCISLPRDAISIQHFMKQITYFHKFIDRTEAA